MTAKQTAREAYQQHRNDIARLLDWMSQELDEHASRMEESANWGRVGDLAALRAHLIENLASISLLEANEIHATLSEPRANA